MEMKPLKVDDVKLQCNICKRIFTIGEQHKCSCGVKLCPSCHGETGITTEFLGHDAPIRDDMPKDEL